MGHLGVLDLCNLSGWFACYSLWIARAHLSEGGVELLKVEGEGDHLGATAVDAFGELEE